eukprot:15351600-Ditylum_brightwellii.AAC.1
MSCQAECAKAMQSLGKHVPECVVQTLGNMQLSGGRGSSTWVGFVEPTWHLLNVGTDGLGCKWG